MPFVGGDCRGASTHCRRLSVAVMSFSSLLTKLVPESDSILIWICSLNSRWRLTLSLSSIIATGLVPSYIADG